MKIATITCHDVYNYGASLQAYALQHYLESKGHQVDIIDYKPPYLSGHFSLTAVSGRYNKPIIKQLYLIAKLYGRLKRFSKKHSFDAFTSKFLKLSSVQYNSVEQLRANPPKADVYIAGSDQIWNTILPNGHDAAFYLDFGKSVRKISYAASFATDAIFNGATKFVTDKLKNFDSISVRESSAVNLCNSLGRDDAALVCDPVFLLNKEQWDVLASLPKNLPEKIILVYDCEIGDRLKPLAKILAHHYNAKIVAINFPKKYADFNLPNIGPCEFLGLIAGATAIISNSFHATAFSIIYQKDFYVVPRSENLNSRMSDFLKYLGLGNRLTAFKSESSLQIEAIDYTGAQERLNELIRCSKDFLNSEIR